MLAHLMAHGKVPRDAKCWRRLKDPKREVELRTEARRLQETVKELDELIHWLSVELENTEAA